jgi:hypothetical protein
MLKKSVEVVFKRDKFVISSTLEFWGKTPHNLSRQSLNLGVRAAATDLPSGPLLR